MYNVKNLNYLSLDKDLLLITTDYGVLKEVINEEDKNLNWKILEVKIKESNYSKTAFLKKMAENFEKNIPYKVLLDFTENYNLEDEKKELKREIENFIIYHVLKNSIKFGKKIEVFECKNNKELSYLSVSDIYPIIEDNENREIIFLKGLNSLVYVESSLELYRNIFETINTLQSKYFFDKLENKIEEIKEKYYSKKLNYILHDFSEPTLRENKQKSAKNLNLLLQILKKQNLIEYKDLFLCTTSFNYKNCLKI